MELTAAKTLATQLMDKHGLIAKKWIFKFDDAKSRFGCCSYRKKRISLSAELVKLNSFSQVLDTILHEIAHALVGPREGHGGAWKAMAARIGAKPERCYDETVATGRGNWEATCQHCGVVARRFKEPRRKQGCVPCCKRYNRGGYSDRFMLHFHKVGTPTSQPSTESQQPVPALVTVARVTVPSAPRYVPPAPAITHPVPPPSAYAPNQAAPQTGLAPAKAAIPLKKQLSLF